MDVGSLSDDDLREQLRGFGVNVGPIVSSTRLFYEKKLGKLLASGGVPPPPESEESEEEEEEEEEDAEVQINYRKQEEAPKPKSILRPQYTSTPVSEPSYSPITQPRTATPTHAVRRNIPRDERSSPKKAQSVKPEQQELQQSNGGGGGRFSMILKLLFLLFIVFLVYLVIMNMNPSAQNRIPVDFDEEQV